MRWLGVLLLLVAGGASAKVVMIPAIARECREENTWGDVMECVGNHGQAKVEKALPHARLLRVRRQTDPDDAPATGGVYLYVEQKGWQLGGMVEYAGELLGFDNPTIGGHGVYRFELGSVAHDGDAIIRQRSQVYCTGTGYRCTQIVIACDRLVGGKAVETFRGTVSWKKENDSLHVAGDRTHAGDSCRELEDFPLMFPST